MDISSRGRFYSSFKDNLELEKYLTVLNKKNRYTFCKLRCSNLKLPVEVGRWRNIPYENRFCCLCNSNEIGDEYHYLFVCTNNAVRNIREMYIPRYYYTYPSRFKLQGLLSICNKTVILKLCIFVRKLEALLNVVI